MSTYLTIGSIARHYGIPAWQVRRTIERGFLAEPPRVGAYRVFTLEDLPRIEVALCKAGYLSREGARA